MTHTTANVINSTLKSAIAVSRVFSEYSLRRRTAIVLLTKPARIKLNTTSDRHFTPYSEETEAQATTNERNVNLRR